MDFGPKCFTLVRGRAPSLMPWPLISKIYISRIFTVSWPCNQIQSSCATWRVSFDSGLESPPWQDLLEWANPICCTSHMNVYSFYFYQISVGWSGVQISAGTGNFSLHHRVQNGYGAHPASYPMYTGGSFPGGKSAKAWTWPFTAT
jgi:hypothetical protein